MTFFLVVVAVFFLVVVAVFFLVVVDFLVGSGFLSKLAKLVPVNDADALVVVAFFLVVVVFPLAVVVFPLAVVVFFLVVVLVPAPPIFAVEIDVILPVLST